MKKMTIDKREELRNLIQFIDMAYRINDINEQYRECKKECPAVQPYTQGQKTKNYATNIA